MKTALTCFAAVLLAAAALPLHADPTPEQRTQLENCKIMSGAVFQFAQARDRKQAKMDAFKAVTHGQAYVPGSLLDETLQWAYAHPEERPDTASAHFYGRCVLDTYDARSPDTEGELDIAAQGCQQGHPEAPEAVRDCIDDKTQDIVTRQTALAAAATTAPAATSAVAATPTPSAATVAAAATPAAAQVIPSPAVNAVSVVAVAQASPPPVQAGPVSVPVVPTAPAQPAAPAPVQVEPSQAVASAPSLPSAAPMASGAAPRAPGVTPVVPPAPVSEPVVAPAPDLQAAAPVTASLTAVAPSAAVAVESPPAPVVAQAAPPPLPPAPQSTPQSSAPLPLPAPAKATSAAPVVAKATVPQPVAPAANLPPLPSATATPSGPPPNLAGFGKLTVGMTMDEAYKAMGSHGDIDRDQEGEVHTYMIGDDHGFIEIRPSSNRTLYSIRVVGGADANVAPILNVVLGDGAFVLINNVGMPSSRTPLPGDKELWNYVGRNYAFEISPGGDVIGVRIIDLSYAPGAATAAPAQ